MGTRNVVQVVKDGKVVVAQYGQWDGYPEGQGKTIAKFLHEEMEKEAFLEALGNVRWQTYADMENIVAELAKAFPDRASPDDWYDMELDMEQAQWLKSVYPEMSRDTGAGILKVIQDKKGVLVLMDDSEFIGNSSCEFWYVIDMDKETVTLNGEHVVPFSEWTNEKMEELEELYS